MSGPQRSHVDVFDRVSSLVLFFLPDPHAALASYLRLLRPGGRLGITTFDDDERWAWLDDLRAFSAGSHPSRPPGREMFASTASVDALVAAASFADVTTAVETHDAVFDRFETWWHWSWSHGTRRFWDTVAHDRLDDAR